MTNDFKKISLEEETRFVLECSTAGATSSGAVASVAMPMGKTRKRGSNLIAQEAGKEKVKQKPRQGPLRPQTGGGEHTDKTKVIPRKDKHKKDEYAESLEQALETSLEEGGFNIHRPDPIWVTINGKRWKWFFNYVVGRKAMDTLNAKFRKEGSKNVADWEPADLEDNPEHGIKVSESALDRFRQGAAEREKKHDKIEADRKSAAAQGKTDVKGAVDRLEKQVNAKESMLPKSAFAGSSKNKLGTAGQWRNTGPKANKPAKAGDLVGGAEESIEHDYEGDTVKNSLHTIIRVATHLEKNISDDTQFPEWVSEKIGAIQGMMVTVMNYVISDQEQQDGDRLDQGPTEDHSTATGGWGQGSMNAAYKSSALAGAGHDDRTMEGDDYFNKLKETLEAAVDERSKSQAQWNLMHAVAHNPAFAKKVGVKQSVGKEFSAADTGHNKASLPKRILPKKKK